MTLKLKLIIALVSVALLSGLVIRILLLKSSYQELDSKYQTTCKQLSDVEALNVALSNTIAQYTQALQIKDKMLEDYKFKLNDINTKLKELSDEESKNFLSIRTPDTIRWMLKSTDYYNKVSSDSSTSSVSTKE